MCSTACAGSHVFAATLRAEWEIPPTVLQLSGTKAIFQPLAWRITFAARTFVKAIRFYPLARFFDPIVAGIVQSFYFDAYYAATLKVLELAADFWALPANIFSFPAADNHGPYHGSAAS